MRELKFGAEQQKGRRNESKRTAADIAWASSNALSKIIEGYLYGSAGFPGGLGLPVSLKQIKKSAANFTPEQTRRWEAVQSHCSSIMSFEDF
jgi:hypothetical protein